MDVKNNKKCHCKSKLMDEHENTLIEHLSSLRKHLIACFIVTACMCPVGLFIAPHVIDVLVQRRFPATMGKLHYFSPIEVFWVELQLAFVLVFVAAYSWSFYQI